MAAENRSGGLSSPLAEQFQQQPIVSSIFEAARGRGDLQTMERLSRVNRSFRAIGFAFLSEAQRRQTEKVLIGLNILTQMTDGDCEAIYLNKSGLFLGVDPRVPGVERELRNAEAAGLLPQLEELEGPTGIQEISAVLEDDEDAEEKVASYLTRIARTFVPFFEVSLAWKGRPAADGRVFSAADKQIYSRSPQVSAEEALPGIRILNIAEEALDMGGDEEGEWTPYRYSVLRAGERRLELEVDFEEPRY